jgi:SAM-dependent methyltransferase
MKNLYRKEHELKLKELVTAPMSNLYLMRTVELVLSNLNMSKDDSIFEIGIGSGFETYILSKRSKDVVGIDISERLIKFLNKRLQLDNTKFYVTDATKEPPGEFMGVFDTCICLDVLEHVEDPENFLNFIQKILKWGGYLGMTFPINKEHGRNRFTEEDVYDLFEGPDLRVDIRIVKQNNFGSLISRFYAKVQNILKPSKEADIFENLTAFEMLQNPKRIHWLYKLGIIFLFKISAHTYCEDELGQRALVIAQKV